MMETADINILRQMYATVFGGADLALTLLEEGRAEEAGEHLRRALAAAEEIYLDSEPGGDGPDFS